eukprot:COSAG02_NODE_859_length_16438_cov_11.496236_1_plen_143_part_00
MREGERVYLACCALLQDVRSLRAHLRTTPVTMTWRARGRRLSPGAKIQHFQPSHHPQRNALSTHERERTGVPRLLRASTRRTIAPRASTHDAGDDDLACEGQTPQPGGQHTALSAQPPSTRQRSKHTVHTRTIRVRTGTMFS